MWTVKYGSHSMCAHTHVLITTIRLYFYEFTFLKASHLWGIHAEVASSVLLISFSTIQGLKVSQEFPNSCIWQLYCIQLDGHSG